MGVRHTGFDEVIAGLNGFFDGFAEDLTMAGENARETIVRTTLAGIGENDQPFAPYSKGYQELIDSVGGKPQGTVSLRGLFYHEGQKRKRYRSEKSRRREREGRQAFVRVFAGRVRPDAQFVEGRDFTARTGITRPALGVTDPRSEMSDDLIRVEATDTTLRLVYTSRDNGYMLAHQNGEGRMPKRRWFTFKRAAVVAGMVKVLSIAIEARAVRFGSQQA